MHVIKQRWLENATSSIFCYQMQIDDSTFESIKVHDVTANKHQAILDEFGIDWSEVIYEDLWKSLHCDLAARHWIDIQVYYNRNSSYSVWMYTFEGHADCLTVPMDVSSFKKFSIAYCWSYQVYGYSQAICMVYCV